MEQNDGDSYYDDNENDSFDASNTLLTSNTNNRANLRHRNGGTGRDRIKKVILDSKGKVWNHGDPRNQLDQTTIQKIISFISALIWVGVCGAILYYSDLLYVLFFNPRVYRWLIYIGLVTLLSVFVLASYVTFYLPIVRKIEPKDWGKHPYLIVVGIAAAVLGAISFIALSFGLFPVYHLLSPILLFVLGLGWIYFLSIMAFIM